jgi:spore coat polysaccharide biosynthesis protein SpsF (cytidylyltransferase family)
LREDDGLAEYCRKIVEVYRGSKEDVLDRYYRAAKLHGAKHIMRLTGDDPLIDPEVCDRLIDYYEKEGLDYARLTPDFAEGLDCEIMSFKTLEITWKRARLKSDREHVSLYINNHKQDFMFGFLENESDDSKYRVTVDERADFEVVKRIIQYFGKRGQEPNISQVKRYLDSHVELKRMNAHIVRNEGVKISLANDGVFQPN